MPENTLLSFCMPTYNRASTLLESLPNLIEIASTWSIPIYICDNDSTDNTIEILTKLKKEYPYLYFFKNDCNIGPERNTQKVLGLPQTKYRWLFGDHYKIHDKIALASILKIIESNDYDFLIVNAKDRVKNIPTCVYSDKDILLSEIGWHMTMLSSLIYHKNTLPNLRFSRFENTCFSQTLSIFDYMSDNSFKAYWYSDILVDSFHMEISSTWFEKTVEIAIKKWYFGILSLSPQYKIDSKMTCIRSHSKNTNIFSTKRIFLLRALGGFDFTTLKKLMPVFISTAGLKETLIFFIASLIPKQPLKILYLLYKNKK